MGTFWLSMFTIFIAEMGDKTQLVAMCLASRFNARVVLAGIFAATLLVHVFSVILGVGVGKLIPAAWIGFAAGLAFIGFGLWTMRGDELSDEECANIQGKSAFWLVSSTFFLAELGDKTMIGTTTLATQYSVIPVWLGSTLGMVVADGLAIVVGQMMGKSLPEKAITTPEVKYMGYWAAGGYFADRDELISEAIRKSMTGPHYLEVRSKNEAAA